MAQAIGCDLCQTEAAVMMQSNLTNGDTIGVGEACMVTFFASSLTAMLHGAPPEMLNDLSPVLVPLAAIIGPSEQDMEDGIPPQPSSHPMMAAIADRPTQAEADQSEADHIAAEQSNAMMAEE